MHPATRVAICIGAAGLLAAGCSREQQLEVKATAYNSTRAQTDGRPDETACGTKLEPGRKVIAVSRDLRDAGLGCGTTVRIEGMEGEWTVEDVTAARHENLIDLYMGKDVKRAREFGRQDVEIRWRE